MKSIVIVTAFASSTSAFSVANIGRFMKKANTVTLYSTKPVLETTPEKTITDPLGLYSDNSIEKKEGLLQPLDNTETETIKKNIRDPMGLYPKGSIEREEGLLQESNTPKDERAVRDPLGLYSREAPERQDGLIKPLEIVPEPEGIVKDPLNLYMNKDEIDEKSEMSLSLPFLTRPKMLDGSLPGDRGFDPLNFSKDRESLAWYRNAEIKHARIAMLAAIGWPISELWDEKLAEAFGLRPLVDFEDRVPSILNGGLSHTPLTFWIITIMVTAAIEIVDIMNINGAKEKGVEYSPGDLGFDPFNLFGESSEERFYKKEAELFNGRLSMLAITAFAVQEWWTKIAVINETPFLFKPLFFS